MVVTLLFLSRSGVLGWGVKLLDRCEDNASENSRCTAIVYSVNIAWAAS